MTITRVNLVLVSLLAVSISISALATSRLLESGSQQYQPSIPASIPRSEIGHAPVPNSNPGVTGAPAGGSASSQPSTQQYGPSSNTGGAPDSKSLAAPSAPSAQGSPGSSVSLYAPLYYSSPYLMPISWGIFFGALIWRGRLRSAWCKQGYDYDTFKLVARMKGSPLRVKLLQLVDTPKNRLQLANELQVDWRTIDNHIQALARNSLVEETVSVGTTKYYRLTEHGRRILALLTENEQDVFRSVDPVSESS